MTNYTLELIEKAKAAKSAEELFELAQANHIELTEEEAKTYFEQLHTNGAVSDDDLEAVSGGGICEIIEDFFKVRTQSDENNCPHCGDKLEKTSYDSSVTTLPFESNGKNDNNRIQFL